MLLNITYLIYFCLHYYYYYHHYRNLALKPLSTISKLCDYARNFTKHTPNTSSITARHVIDMLCAVHLQSISFTIIAPTDHTYVIQIRSDSFFYTCNTNHQDYIYGYYVYSTKIKSCFMFQIIKKCVVCSK